MPRKKKNVESVVVSPASAGEHEGGENRQVENDHEKDHDQEDSDSGPTELNRLISEEEYSNGKAEVVVMNHTPATSSPSSSHSRHNSQSRPVVDSSNVDEDLDKISSEDNREPGPPEDEDEDVVDEATRLTKPDEVEDEENKPVQNQPSGEYKKIMEMLKEAEAEADPEYEETKRRMDFLTKYNPRHPDSGLGFMDYCCAFFQCFALCIEG